MTTKLYTLWCCLSLATAWAPYYFIYVGEKAMFTKVRKPGFMVVGEERVSFLDWSPDAPRIAGLGVESPPRRFIVVRNACRHFE